MSGLGGSGEPRGELGVNLPRVGNVCLSWAWGRPAELLVQSWKTTGSHNQRNSVITTSAGEWTIGLALNFTQEERIIRKMWQRGSVRLNRKAWIWRQQCCNGGSCPESIPRACEKAWLRVRNFRAKHITSNQHYPTHLCIKSAARKGALQGADG